MFDRPAAVGSDRPTRFELAILGSTRFSQHLAAVESISPQVRLAGCVCQEDSKPSGRHRQDEFDVPTYSSYDDALADDVVVAIAVCTPPAERLYWIRRSAAAGKHVISEAPVVASYRQTRDLADLCRLNESCVAVAVEPSYRELAGAIEERGDTGEIGRALYIDLEISVPSADLADTGDGVVLLHGQHALSVLTHRFGHLDSMYARTRSLKLNRPAEDIAVAQLRFSSGLEGIIQVNALGDRGVIRFALYGSGGTTEHSADLRTASAHDLACQYADFVAAAESKSAPEFGCRELVRGAFLSEWLHQSARQDREIYRRDVQVG